MTNITDTLPDGSTVTSLVEAHDHGAFDASTRFGQTHDTWHRESSSVPPDGGGGTLPPRGVDIAGLLSVYALYCEVKPPFNAPPQPAAVGEILLTISINGTLVGPYMNDAVPFGESVSDPGWADINDPGGGASSFFNKIDHDGVDHTAWLTPLNGQNVTLTWTEAT